MRFENRLHFFDLVRIRRDEQQLPLHLHLPRVANANRICVSSCRASTGLFGHSELNSSYSKERGLRCIWGLSVQRTKSIPSSAKQRTGWRSREGTERVRRLLVKHTSMQTPLERINLRQSRSAAAAKPWPIRSAWHSAIAHVMFEDGPLSPA
jgi:hypothetical protein